MTRSVELEFYHCLGHGLTHVPPSCYQKGFFPPQSQRARKPLRQFACRVDQCRHEGRHHLSRARPVRTDALYADAGSRLPTVLTAASAHDPADQLHRSEGGNPRTFSPQPDRPIDVHECQRLGRYPLPDPRRDGCSENARYPPSASAVSTITRFMRSEYSPRFDSANQSIVRRRSRRPLPRSHQHRRTWCGH